MPAAAALMVFQLIDRIDEGIIKSAFPKLMENMIVSADTP